MTEMDVDTIVSFRILGTDVDPDVVSAQLGMQPDDHHRVGDAVSGRSGAVRKHGYWALRSTNHLASSVDANQHIDWLVQTLGGKLPILHTFAERGAMVDVTLAVHTSAGHGGPVLRPEVLGRLASLGLAVNLDLYPDA